MAAEPAQYPDPVYSARWAGRTLDINDIMTIIPHRPPFLLVDRVTDLVPGDTAIGHKAVTINEWFFTGHFPGFPVMPGVLICEAMAQTAGVVVMSCVEPGRYLPLFTGMTDVRFRRPVRPGDTLRIYPRTDKVAARFGKLICRFTLVAKVDDEVACEGAGSFALVPVEGR